MRQLSIVLAMLLLAVSAQASVIGIQFSSGDHTACSLDATIQANYCIATDGVWWSKAGAAYQLYGAQSGNVVTSFNGKTGAVTSATAGILFSDLQNKPTGFVCTQFTHDSAGKGSCAVATLSFQ